jgi:TRAP-type C4-dicarboxylate transport system permease small subunit
MYISFVGMAALMAMMLITALDVAGRVFFNKPIPGTFELSDYLLTVSVLLSIGFAQQQNRNVRVDLFLKKMPNLAQTVTEIIWTFLSIALLSLVTWQGIIGGIEAINNTSVSDILRVPSFPFRFLIAVGAFLLALELLIKLILLIANLMNPNRRAVADILGAEKGELI